MERALSELISRTHREVAYDVISATLAEDLRPLVTWHPVKVPKAPFPLKFLAFQIRAGLHVRRFPRHVVHCCGAIVPNRVDVASVHFCHKGFRQARRGAAPEHLSIPRRVNAAATRVLSLLAERWTYTRRAGVLACVSTTLESEVTKHYPSAATAFTPNGVDHERFAADAASRVALRSQHEVAEDEVVVLFVGGDWARKGLDLAVRAVALAQPSVTARLRLWVVGAGDEARYARLADECGLAPAVTFFGRREDTERFYSAADIFVLPSLYEAFPLVAMEAAAAGLPVIGTRVNGITELIAEGHGGTLVDRSARSLVEALATLCTDRDQARRLGENGAQFISGYTWERSSASVLALYHRASQDAQRTHPEV